MAYKWTNEQIEAINQRGCNLLVAAAAGAGKTAVLVERIIKKITDPEKPVDIDKLLVVTFTNAAATEMRERIGQVLAERLDRNPADANLQNQMALLDRANIMTLHSFCLDVVRSHFQSLDLDPSFRVADETESLLMKLESLEELFEEKYESEDTESEFFRLVDSYGGRGDNSLRDMILSLHRYAQSHPWPEKWLAEQAEAFNPDALSSVAGTPWAQVLLKDAAEELEGLAAMVEKARAEACRAEGLEPYCSVLEEDFRQLLELAQVCRKAQDLSVNPGPVHGPHTWQVSQEDSSFWDEVHRAFASYTPPKLTRCGKNADKGAQDKVKAVRNIVKNKVKKLCESGFGANEAQIREDFAVIYPLFKYLAGMICRFDEIYSEKKKAKGLLDFNDLEHYCLKVLIEDGKPTQAAMQLSSRFEEILVDEYQDTNLIQEIILTTVSGNRCGIYNIFMVGDVKQSIYRFRQAMPELFLTKYEFWPKEPGHESRVIKLYKNFRSRPEVINGINFIFKQIMSESVGELDYNEEEALNPGAVFEPPEGGRFMTGGPVELHIIDVASKEAEILPAEGECGLSEEGNSEGGTDAVGSSNIADGTVSGDAEGAVKSSADASNGSTGGSTDEAEADEQEPFENVQAEARIIGERIRKLVSKEKGIAIYDKDLDNGPGRKKGGYRKAEYRDIVILMRATSGCAGVFADELSAMGIPAYADTGMGYFDAVEVETVLCLLKIIDNPLQDIPMLAVLRSPIGGFSADELAEIRLMDKTVSIYEALKLYAQQSPKAEDFLKKLEKWRDISRYTPVDELVWMLLTETGYLTYVGVLPGGPERQANLRMLFERARQYEQTSYKGLFNFINFIGRLRSGGGDMGTARILGENENVVRIMSIHKSKGLEFPIVFVAGLGRRFNLQDLNERILLHQELGFGPDVVNLDKRTISTSMPKSAIRQKLHLEALSEEMRILYVAFTRAKEKLILTGCVRDIQKACTKWCTLAQAADGKLPGYEIRQALNYLDWIGPAVARHKSGKPLRQMAELDSDEGIRIFEEDDSCWEIKFWGMGAATCAVQTDSAAEDFRNWLEEELEALGESGDSLYNELVRKLEWEYRYKALTSVPAKISVTELKRRLADADEEAGQDSAGLFAHPVVGKPLFMEPDSGFDAARKGTIMHFVMQQVDLKKISEALSEEDRKGASGILLSELGRQLACMVEKEQLTQPEADVVNLKAIEGFFRTPLGRRMLLAETVHRETAFTVEIKATEVYRELPEDIYGSEMLLLQGVIDCWFETSEGIVLIDYKTDFVPAGGGELIRKRYETQVSYYTRALEKITGRKVSEKYLYLFHSGELMKC